MKNPLEYKSIGLEVKDLDASKREAVLAHATYDSVDRTKDIARKGMFLKSWKESKDDISYYLNHDENQVPGKPTDFWEDNQHAYTKVYHGTHTLGNDTLIMIDEGIIKKVSFGYVPEVKSYITHNNQKVRELKQVRHVETSVLTKLQAHPDSKVVSVTKAYHETDIDFKSLSQSEQRVLKSILAADQSALEQLFQLWLNADPSSDLYSQLSYVLNRRIEIISDTRWQLKYNSSELKEVQSHIETMEKFCRNTKASDDCILMIQSEINEAKDIIARYDVTTQPITEPGASSENNSMLYKQLLILKTQIHS